MDTGTARELATLTKDFYAKWASSFSASRDHPWPGWTQCLPYIEPLIDPEPRSVTVLDLACGNLRFLDFLRLSLPAVTWNWIGVDTTATMAPPERPIHHLDIMAALFDGRLSEKLQGAPIKVSAVDLSVCFGFLHHVPQPNLRRRLVETLIERTRPQGLVILTAWQFARDDQARAKAVSSTNRAAQRWSLDDLDEGDYLLGWRGDDSIPRYCHSFSDTEIDHLITAVSPQADLIARFRADGKTGEMNTYLVFRVKDSDEYRFALTGLQAGWAMRH